MSRHIVIRRVKRASGGQNSPELVATRMRSFASSLSPRTAATFLAVMTDEGLENYLVTPDTDSMNKAAMSAAHAVTGRLSYVDELPELDRADEVRHLFYRPGGTRSSTTQAGRDPFSMAASLADMPVGSWVAITMRAPRRGLILHEDRLWDRWIKGRIVGGTHHSLEPNGVIAHVAAASTSRSGVDSLLRQVAGDMHGFDLETRSVRFPRPWVIAQFLATSLLFLGAGIGLRLLAPTLAAVLPPALVGTVSTAVMLAAFLPVLALLAYVAWGLRYERRFRDGRFPLPRRRWALRTRPPTQSNDQGLAESAENFLPSGGAKRQEKEPGDYPLNRGSFKLGALLPVGALAPASGSASGTSETGDRHAPAPLLRRIGPVIGLDAIGRMVRLSASDLWAGIAVFGKPRSGKSYLLRSLFAFLMMDQQPLLEQEAESPEQAQSKLGDRGAIFAFESKSGKDAAEYQAWARTLGSKKVHVFDLADPDGARIDMFSDGSDTRDSAAKLVEKMIYHWGSDSIGAASAKTLRGVFTTALGAPARVLTEAIETHPEEAPSPAPVATPMAIAHALLGAYGDEFGQHLAETIRRRLSDVKKGRYEGDVEQLEIAVGGLSELYGASVKSASRAALQKAPSSKVEVLMLAPHWWRSDGRVTTIEEILRRHLRVVINSGATSTLTGASRDNLRLPATVGDALSGMILYSLKEAIQDVCAGWEERGRYVAIICDELARVARNSPDVIEWTRMQGRAFGVIPIYATQEPEQLVEDVRRTMFSLSTVVSYAQENENVAAQIARDFSGGATEGFEVVHTKEVMDLPRYMTLVRTVLDQQRQNVLTAKVHPFEDDRDAFRSVVYPPTQED
ncbi:hypothetical protein [Brachybacterium sacelli]|uniref:TraD/TraG TraM recognition site domain-containing protein n=1 Tax=Brachybacterium sacelli TaxID=173364 RepID=A0ABS4X680_9MICO|nr:hypothetical protein [Brachybacterium sacelli]MBP2383753.1 hypothetical protein [Brachybacterium sacelli]